MSTTAIRIGETWAGGSPLLALATRALPAFLLRQRWYSAKDAGSPEVRLDAILPLQVPGTPAALASWLVETGRSPPLRFFVPLALTRSSQLGAAHPAVIAAAEGDALLVDAFALDDFVRAFLHLLIRSLPLDAELHAQSTAAARTADLPGTAAIRRDAAEQSNTSIRIGERAILKVIRKLEPGVHPEVEMGRFLTEQAHFGGVPALLGSLEWRGATIGILQDFVISDGDGWSWILAHLRRDDAGQRAAALAWVRRLGEVTAEMHLALATRCEDPAFEPEPVASADWQAWVTGIAQSARDVTESLRRARPDLDPALTSDAEAFERLCEELPCLVRRLLPVALPVAKTRHHGDFHLGQVLVRGADAVIVDFEGEPLRPLAERRAKHVPLRDAAGMLRSFAYAAAVIERELPPAPSAEREGRLERLRRWIEEASEAYLESYLRIAAAGPGWPGERYWALRLVQFFSIEKSIYEMAYELAHRPAWVAIPLRSAVSLLELASEGAVRRSHSLPQGAEALPEGGVRFRFWAPRAERVSLALDGAGLESPLTLGMRSDGEGWHELTVPEARAGSRYQFVLPDGMRVPDPASRYQPEDVHGPSEVIDPHQYAWRDGSWAGRPWHEAVIYELHMGAFTQAGTFRAAIERLDHLQALGVTAVEIMPVADFPGRRNWGYDGVLPYAPDASYGRPEDLKAFVDAAHSHGIMVLLDVVYNHFGPDGNYLPVYAPGVFTERHHTPWGAAVNYDGAGSRPVREFIIHNALYWIEEFNLDGLRLDAVHAIHDDGPIHLLDELAERVRAVRQRAHLVLENEENEARPLMRAADGAPVHYTAQWNDDLHHVLHVAATAEGSGYYQDYLGDAEKLGRALAEGFAFQGQVMDFRGTGRGEPSGGLPPTAFVAFMQNHDQIGNRALGGRISAIAPPEAVRAIATVYLLLPQIPMLFMGEEWAAEQPFPFFCDFDGPLAAAVSLGRREEFARFPEFRDASMRERIPDPQADSTFASAKLQWDALQDPRHRAWLRFYARALAVRRDALVPVLPLIEGHAGSYQVKGPAAVAVHWRLKGGGRLVLAANLSASPVGGFTEMPGRLIWRHGAVSSTGLADPWSACWWLSTP